MPSLYARVVLRLIRPALEYADAKRRREAEFIESFLEAMGPIQDGCICDAKIVDGLTCDQITLASIRTAARATESIAIARERGSGVVRATEPGAEA